MMPARHLFRLAVAGLAVALAWPSSSASTQGLNFALGGDQPIEVNADEGIEWHQAEQVFTARGNAVAARGDVRVEADLLRAYYRQRQDGTSDIWRLDAEGNVRITTVDKKATCDRATYVAANGELVLTGNAKVSRGADVMEGDKITFWTNEDRVICEPGHMRMRLGGDMGALTGSGKREAGD